MKLGFQEKLLKSVEVNFLLSNIKDENKKYQYQQKYKLTPSDLQEFEFENIGFNEDLTISSLRCDLMWEILEGNKKEYIDAYFHFITSDDYPNIIYETDRLLPINSKSDIITFDTSIYTQFIEKSEYDTERIELNPIKLSEVLIYDKIRYIHLFCSFDENYYPTESYVIKLTFFINIFGNKTSPNTKSLNNAFMIYKPIYNPFNFESKRINKRKKDDPYSNFRIRK